MRMSKDTTFNFYMKCKSIFCTNNTFVIFQILHEFSNDMKMNLMLVQKFCFCNQFLSRKSSLFDVFEIDNFFHTSHMI